VNDNQTQALVEAIDRLVDVMGMIEENTQALLRTQRERAGLTAGIDSTLKEMLGLIYDAQGIENWYEDDPQ
jgi:hypothetical protein